MQPDDRDAALLWDMRHAACEIAEFTKGLHYQQFESNKVVHYAVERQILVIGEAAKNISSAFKNAHSEIPWQPIISQRNILAHEYGEILTERIWRVASERTPELIRLLDAVVPEPPGEDRGA